jgi:hypothetical protein
MTNHLGSREVDVLLRDGSTVHVCPAKPSDAPAVRLLLQGLSDRSRWLRFLSAFPDLAMTRPRSGSSCGKPQDPQG